MKLHSMTFPDYLLASLPEEVTAANELLASSPHGAVWRALWNAPDGSTPDVAIKVSAANCKADVPLAHAPVHPNIVHVYRRTTRCTQGTGEECLVEIRELCLGGCLFELISSSSPTPYFSHNGLPWTSSSTPSAAGSGKPDAPLQPELVQVMRWFRQLVSAVAYCHVQGVVCGQLRREHVLLSRDGDLKLLGFRHFCPTAQAAKHDPKLAAGAMMRSVRLKSWVHMDPPEFRGRASCRISECLPADVYAIGALIALLCGIDKLHMDDGTVSSTRRPAKSTPSSRGTSVSWSPKSGPASRTDSVGSDLNRMSTASSFEQLSAASRASYTSLTNVACASTTMAPICCSTASASSDPGGPSNQAAYHRKMEQAMHFFPTPVRKLLTEMVSSEPSERPTAMAASAKLSPLDKGAPDLGKVFPAPPLPSEEIRTMRLQCPGWSGLSNSAASLELKIRASLSAMRAKAVPCDMTRAAGSSSSDSFALLVFDDTDAWPGSCSPPEHKAPVVAPEAQTSCRPPELGKPVVALETDKLSMTEVMGSSTLEEKAVSQAPPWLRAAAHDVGLSIGDERPLPSPLHIRARSEGRPGTNEGPNERPFPPMAKAGSSASPVAAYPPQTHRSNSSSSESDADDTTSKSTSHRWPTEGMVQMDEAALLVLITVSGEVIMPTIEREAVQPQKEALPFMEQKGASDGEWSSPLPKVASDGSRSSPSVNAEASRASQTTAAISSDRNRIDVRRLHGSYEAFYSFYGQLCDQMGRRLQDAGGTAPSSSPMISQWWARPGSVLATPKGMLPRASSYETGLATLMSDPKSRAPSRAAPANGRSGNALASPRGPPEARSSGMNSINRNLRGQGERLATIQASISGSWSCGLDALEALEAVEDVDGKRCPPMSACVRIRSRAKALEQLDRLSHAEELPHTSLGAASDQSPQSHPSERG